MIYDGSRTFDNLERVVRKATKALRPHADRFDAIIVQGVSGMSVGFPVALRLRKPILVLRKPDEDDHDWSRLIGEAHLRSGQLRVLFLDDLVEEGGTRYRCGEAVARKGGRLVGEYLYDERRHGGPQLYWEPDWSTGWNGAADPPPTVT